MNKKQAALMLKIMELISTLLSEVVVSSPHLATIQSYIWFLRESFGFTYYEALDTYAIASDEETTCTSEEPKKRMIDADELLSYMREIQQKWEEGLKATTVPEYYKYCIGAMVACDSIAAEVEAMLKK